MKKKYENSLREIIKEYNLKPKKKLGQNFLHDKNIISAIIRKADVENEDIIEEGEKDLSENTGSLNILNSESINNKKISHLLKEINKQVKEPRFEF